MKMKQCPAIDINFDAIAKGLIQLMHEAGDETSLTVMRFGMLPKTWMDMAQKDIHDKITELCRPYIQAMQEANEFCKSNGLTAPPDPHDFVRWVASDRKSYEFTISDLTSDAMHELALALYNNTEMVV